MKKKPNTNQFRKSNRIDPLGYSIPPNNQRAQQGRQNSALNSSYNPLNTNNCNRVSNNKTVKNMCNDLSNKNSCDNKQCYWYSNSQHKIEKGSKKYSCKQGNSQCPKGNHCYKQSGNWKLNTSGSAIPNNC